MTKGHSKRGSLKRVLSHFFGRVRLILSGILLVFVVYTANYIRIQLLLSSEDIIKDELRQVEFVSIYKNRTLREFQVENGGQPIRNLIVTTGRSGSTFLSEILNTHPATFYFDEPLNKLWTQKLDEEKFKAFFFQKGDYEPILRELFKCEFSGLTPTNKFWTMSSLNFMVKKRLREVCQENEPKCELYGHINDACAKYPVQNFKFIRLRLKDAEPLLSDPDLNVRIIYLVRDPRGTVRSRGKIKAFTVGLWASTVLCTELVDDHTNAVKLREKYPENFMVVFYEDLALNPIAVSRRIFKFLHLQFHLKTLDFLHEHTKKNEDGSFNVHRNSKSRPFLWINEAKANFTVLKNFQIQCKAAISAWGYQLVNSSAELENFNPYKKFVF